MMVRTDPPTHLTYCLNVHAGESWSANLAAIRTHALAVRRRVAADRRFGLGLRLSRSAADELAQPAALAAFRDFLAANDLYVFTINGFPYGDFHDTQVKQQVYAPDWRSHERLVYTLRLADILAELLPDQVTGSISTVPGSYRSWFSTRSDTDALVRNLAACAAHLAELEAATGRHIVLALEPEPDCLIDTTDGSLDFFNNVLGKHDALAALPFDWRRYLGICLDACHLAVLFENPTASLQALHRHGIAVPKVHLSAALRGTTGPAMARRLADFMDGVYLHQVCIRRMSGEIIRLPDLNDMALKTIAREEDAEVRVHTHIPLYFEGDRELHSTSCDLSTDFFCGLRDTSVSHLEIETYTFGILPDSLASLTVEDSVCREFDWVVRRLNA